MQPAIHRGRKNLGELFRPVFFITPQTKSHDSQVAVAQSSTQCPPGELARLAAPVIDDQAALDAEGLLSLGKAREYRLKRHLPIAEPGAVRSQRERDFRIADSLRSLVLTQLECDAAKILGLLQA